jgi:exodeoxyribonuclease-3
MDNKKIISWNINGIRAIFKKGISDFLNQYNPDILCFQEIKASEEQIKENIPKHLKDYYVYFNSAEKKGYSGVATYSKIKPKKIEYGLTKDTIDKEGRVLKTTFDKFILYNIYFPNGKRDQERLDYKIQFYNELINVLKDHNKKGDKVIILGDYNTAHKEIDLARPKENSKISGFLDIERELIDELIKVGYIDSLRMFNNSKDMYTWWDPITKARERNVGWRIDYVFVSNNIKNKLTDANILSNIYGSDHCPVSIDINL